MEVAVQALTADNFPIQVTSPREEAAKNGAAEEIDAVALTAEAAETEEAG